MSAPLAQSIHRHHYPKLLFRYPRLLRLLHFGVAATTLRTWYVRRALRRLLANRQAPFRYLDAGCGAGDFLLPYALAFPASTFIGVDHIEDNVALCTRYAEATGGANLILRQADLQTFLPQPPVDVIACITVLQYIEDDRQVLAHCYRGLKDGGALLLYLPVLNNRFFRWYEPLLARLFSEAQYDVVQQRRRIYAPDEVFEKLAEAGFTLQQTTYAYGTAGQVAYELHSLALLIFGHLPKGLAFLLGLPVFLLLYPILLLLMSVDFARTNRSGNGLLVVAKKAADHDASQTQAL